jgi:hypothetical protein
LSSLKKPSLYVVLVEDWSSGIAESKFSTPPRWLKMPKKKIYYINSNFVVKLKLRIIFRIANFRSFFGEIKI